MNNRGRFQAQDDVLERSSSWATNDEISKEQGNLWIDDLEGKLTAGELAVRVTAMQKARNFVNNAPVDGHYAVIVKSYYDDPRNRQVRVDVEIRAGRAFLTVNIQN